MMLASDPKQTWWMTTTERAKETNAETTRGHWRVREATRGHERPLEGTGGHLEATRGRLEATEASSHAQILSLDT